MIAFSQFFLKTSCGNFTSVDKIIDRPNNGIIQIDKIKLKKTFTENGNVDNGIIVIKPSVFPDIYNSILILAGHSGTGLQAYFNDLYKLVIGDTAVVEYNNNKYVYRLEYVYYEKKDGTIKITKIKNTKTLVLVTCTNNRKDLQTVYVFKIID